MENKYDRWRKESEFNRNLHQNIIVTLIPTRIGPITEPDSVSRPDRGAQPKYGWWAPSHNAIYRGGGWWRMVRGSLCATNTPPKTLSSNPIHGRAEAAGSAATSAPRRRRPRCRHRHLFYVYTDPPSTISSLPSCRAPPPSPKVDLASSLSFSSYSQISMVYPLTYELK
jgi:hypothetical protein